VKSVGTYRIGSSHTSFQVTEFPVAGLNEYVRTIGLRCPRTLVYVGYPTLSLSPRTGSGFMANDLSASTLTGKLQIEVFGADLDGHQFIEHTRTLTITRDGATIALVRKLAPDSELIVRNPATNEVSAARVADLMRDDIFVQVYAIAFIDPIVNLWQFEFPQVESKNTDVMECDRCHAVDAVLISDIEMEILESKQTLRRFCECSNSSTVWKPTNRRVTERKAAERETRDRRSKIPPADETASSTPSERRRQRRTAMKVPASIRCDGWEDVVECEDVSRGGFRFTSLKRYPARTLIEAAAPYAKNSINIFVTARIAYQQQLSGRLYRHGVEYVKSIK
jgi:hypothetical protein